MTRPFGHPKTSAPGIASELFLVGGTFTAPAAGDYLVYAMPGGGAGGYDNGSGGSSGQPKCALVTLAAGEEVPVSIGQGGVSTVGGETKNGGATTFGGYLTTTGGEGGTANATSNNTTPGGTASYGGAGYTSPASGGSNGQSVRQVPFDGSYFQEAVLYIGSISLRPGTGGAPIGNSGGGGGGVIVNGDTTVGGTAAPASAAVDLVHSGQGYGAGGVGGVGGGDRRGGSGAQGFLAVTGPMPA